MLQDSKAFSGFSVDDLDKAQKFYGETLGIKITEEIMGDDYKTIILHLPGSNGVFIYPKPDHKPATYTTLNFPVNDIKQVVKELKEKGITFEQYTDPFLKTDEDGISWGQGKGPNIAWFKDPAGNILSVLEDK